MDLPGYKVIRHLGQEEFASVYLAIQLSVGRQVCLKVVDNHLHPSPDIHHAFQQQAEHLQRLSHPGIMRIFEHGHYRNFFYIAAQYSPGHSLPQHLAKKNLPLVDKLAIFQQIAEILFACHRQGYALIEPQLPFFHVNLQQRIILTQAPGILHIGQDNKLRHSLIHKLSKKEQLQHAYYLSPEQSQGQLVDQRSDYYALGIILHILLLGKPPFSGKSTVNIAVQHLHTEAPLLPTDLSGFQPLLQQLLEKNPQQRIQNDIQLLQAIDNILSQTSDEDLPTATTRRFKPWFDSILDGKRWRGRLPTIPMQRLSGLRGLRLSLHHGLVYWPNNHSAILTANHLTALSPIPSKSAGFTTTFTQALQSGHAIQLLSSVKSNLLLASLLLMLSTGLLFIILEPAPHHASVKQQGKTANAEPVLPSSIGKAIPATINKTQKPAPAKETAMAQQPTAAPSITAKNADKASLFALKVSAEPEQALIRVMNIKPSYHPGILLTAGDYLLHISAPGYRSQNHWIKLMNEDVSKHYRLQKR